MAPKAVLNCFGIFLTEYHGTVVDLDRCMSWSAAKESIEINYRKIERKNESFSVSDGEL